MEGLKPTLTSAISKTIELIIPRSDMYILLGDSHMFHFFPKLDQYSNLKIKYSKNFCKGIVLIFCLE